MSENVRRPRIPACLVPLGTIRNGHQTTELVQVNDLDFYGDRPDRGDDTHWGSTEGIWYSVHRVWISLEIIDAIAASHAYARRDEIFDTDPWAFPRVRRARTRSARLIAFDSEVREALDALERA